MSRMFISRPATRERLPRGFRVGADYVLHKLIGRGSFGDVYAATHQRTGARVAVKVEGHGHATPRLANEARAYEALHDTPGFPRVYWFGELPSVGADALVMELLGPSLQQVQRSLDGPLSLRATLHVGQELLSRLQAMHQLGYVYGDCKPGNALLPQGFRIDSPLGPTPAPSSSRRYDGPSNATTSRATSASDPRDGSLCERLEGESLYLVDLGFSRPLGRVLSGRRRGRRGLVGSSKYASLPNHRGEPFGRRDDLEALVYTLAFLGKGRLPWSNVQGETKQERFAIVSRIKSETSVESLAEGLSPGYAEFVRRCRMLERDEMPNYEALRQLLRNSREEDILRCTST